MNIKFNNQFVFILLTVLLGISCGRAHLDHSRIATEEQMRPLNIPATLQTTHGDVSIIVTNEKKERLWTPGETVIGLTQIKAHENTSAVFGQGQKIAKLWMRSGATVGLGTMDDGGFYVEIISGEIRFSSFDVDSPTWLVTAQGFQGISIAGGDVIISKNKNSEPHLVATAAHPSWADWSLSMELEPEPVGIGSLQANIGEGEIARLELRSVNVTAQLAGDMVVNRVEQIFYNDSNQQLEGTFRFPLPNNASVTSLAMEIDGRLMEGELVEREKARKTYEAIVDSMRDPALLEWEQGQMFKLRVFPIEPNATKRIVLTFLSPLRRGPSGWEYVYATAAADMQTTIDSFTLSLDQNKIKLDNFKPGKEIAIPIADEKLPQNVTREMREDGTYTAVRISPNWNILPSQKNKINSPKSQDLIVVFDTSRSALENQDLALQSLEIVLRSLRPTDRFFVTAGDIVYQNYLDDFVKANDKNILGAINFVTNIKPDGASDLALALTLAAKIGKTAQNPHLVYIGDGTATWGITDRESLIDLAQQNLEQIPFSAVSLGKGASTQLMQDMAGRLGGRVIRPRTARQVRSFGLFVAHASELKRLRKVKLVTPDGHMVYPQGETTLFEGDEIVALVRTDKDKKSPSKLAFQASFNNQMIEQSFNCDNAADQRYVAHQWASKRIAHLQTNSAKNRDEIITTSLDFGVMSRFTSFLVLESEEAYRRHGIERRRGPGQSTNTPRVTGADLESVDHLQARLAPGNIQPGDPEIRIPAPSNARSVVVVFPFGITKVAVYEPQLEAWVVRFLIDPETPDGTYEVIVRVTHFDGEIEIIRLSYLVDTNAPVLNVTLNPVENKPGIWELNATQIITQSDIKSLSPRFKSNEFRSADISPDVRRVEIKMPSGRIIRLARDFKTGDFHARFRSDEIIDQPIEVNVVAFDRALNTGETTMTLDPRGADDE